MVTNHASTMPPIMVAVHGYNLGVHHGTTIRLAHGRAVVIAAWRSTTRITTLLPYRHQPLEVSYIVMSCILVAVTRAGLRGALEPQRIQMHQ